MAMKKLTMVVVLVAALVSGFARDARGAVSVPSWFGDNMVFQKNTEYGARSFINGKARPGEKVMVSFGGRGFGGGGSDFPATADADGNWEVEFNNAGVGAGPGTVTVSGEDGPSITAKNVMGGDVYFCSGQSNMVFPLKNAFNPIDEQNDIAQYKDFRFFTTARAFSDVPLFDFSPNSTGCDAEPCNQWLTMENATAPINGNPNNTYLQSFSAVCAMTIRDIARMHTGGRPVALIQSAWGGTRVEAWMSSDAIKAGIANGGATPPVKPAQNNASVLWNAMVAPWQKFSVRAALWYQGEANADQIIDGVDQTQYYAAMYQAMIADWRDKKGMGDFTFGTVQLPPSLPATDNPTTALSTGRMQIRLAEAETIPHPNGKTDNSAVSVSLDMGGKSAWGFDHPPNKNEISRRLALQLVHAAFAQQGSIPQARVCPDSHSNCNTSSLWTGPLVDSVSLQDGKVVVNFLPWSAVDLKLKNVTSKNIDGSDNGCSSRNGLPSCCNGLPPFELFEGSNWTRVSASRMIVQDSSSSIILTPSHPGATPSQVRFAWADYVDCVVVNSDDLPAGPFKLNVSSAPLHKKSEKPISQHMSSSEMIQSPPMGTNTWNFYHCNIDENIVKAMTDYFHSNGMAAAGYEYINIDDCWQVARDENGTIIPDPVRFPSGMRALADYVHSKGLKFGLYTARGSGTCQGRPGSLNFELIDAATYCDWNLDYIKIDACHGAQDPQTSWTRFHKGISECFNRTGRQIVQSVESCDSPSTCGQWVTSVANLWRTGGDVQNYWGSIMNNAHANDRMANVAKPGHFNDPDMLQVGNVGLTQTEQESHFALWCIAGAPLLAGTDIEHVTPATLEILTAPELIEINQDLGLNGKIQGKHVGSANESAVGDKQSTNQVIVKSCTGSSSQKWNLVPSHSGDAVYISSKSDGSIVEVPHCARAAFPFGIGPALDVTSNKSSSECNGANQLFIFQKNGTITTNVDGQCLNARQGGPVVQTFSCVRQGTQSNGLWKYIESSGEIVEQGGKCLSIGAAPVPPSPPSSGSELWVKQLSDGNRTAVVLLNLNDDNSMDLSFSSAMIQVSYTSMAVRDARNRKDLGTFSGVFTAKSVAPHESIVLTVTQA